MILPSKHAVVGLVLISAAVFAGEEAVVPESNGGDWCECLTEAFRVHDDKESKWVQQFKFYFLYQHQFGYVDGKDRTGRDFNDKFEETRRFWAGIEGRVLDHFKFKAVSQLSNDRHNYPFGERQWGHETFRSAYIAFDAKNAFEWDFVDAFEVGYGRRSIRMAEEWQRSASHINAIERSPFSNKLWPNDEESGNPLAAWVKWRKGVSTIDVALVSGTYDDWIGGWSGDGKMLYSSWLGDFSERTGLETSDFWVSGYYQDSDLGIQRLAGGIEWAAVAAFRLANGPWALHGTVGGGDNGDRLFSRREGGFWGAVLMPMYWIVDDRLKLVLRYQYQGSDESEGIRLNSRYARVAEADSLGAVNINRGRGDEHHNFYAGLNYYFCSDNIKLMFGVDYDELSSNGQKMYKGWTTSTSIRFWF